MPKNVAVLCRVSGYRPGMFYRAVWFAVFDGRGNVYKGNPADTAAAVQIRYCDSCGVPDDWDEMRCVLNPDEFDQTAGVAELLYVMARQGQSEARAAARRNSH